MMRFYKVNAIISLKRAILLEIQDERIVERIRDVVKAYR
jgi:hypothetical protein